MFAWRVLAVLLLAAAAQSGCGTERAPEPPTYLQQEIDAYPPSSEGAAAYPTKGPLSVPLLHIQSDGEQLITCSSQSAFVTSDGQLWSPLAVPPIGSLCTPLAGQLYIDGPSGLTANGTRIPRPTDSAVTEIAGVSSELYAADGTANLYKTRDRQVWTSVNAGPTDTFTLLAAGGNKLYTIGNANRTLYEIDTTRESWAILASVPEDVGPLRTLVASPRDQYVVGEKAILRFDRKGAAWMRLPNLPGSAKALDACIWNDELYISTEEGIYLLRGSSWRVLNRWLSMGAISQVSTDSGRLLAASPGGLFESVDLGGSWQRSMSPVGSLPTEAVVRLDDMQYAATSSGLFRRTNQTDVWLLSPEPFGNDPLSGVVRVSDKLLVIKRSRRGATETEASLGREGHWQAVPPLDGHVISQIVSSGGAALALTSNRGVLLLLPDRPSWAPANHGLAVPAATRCLSASGGAVWAISDFALYRLGALDPVHWERVSSIPKVETFDVWSDPQDPSIVLLGTGAGLYYSTDEGNQFTQALSARRDFNFSRGVSFAEPLDIGGAEIPPILATDRGVWLVAHRFQRSTALTRLAGRIGRAVDSHQGEPLFMAGSLVAGAVGSYVLGMAALIVLVWGGFSPWFSRGILAGPAAKSLQILPRIGRWALFVGYRRRFSMLPSILQAGGTYFGLSAVLPNGQSSKADPSGELLHAHLVEGWKQANRILLVGEAGAGKSTVLARLAWLIAHDRAPHGLKGLMPVLVEPSYYQGNLIEAIASTLRERDRVPCDVAGDVVRDQLRAGGFLILLDGASEVDGIDTKRVLEEWKVTAESPDGRNCKFIVASRSRSPLVGVPTFVLEPIDIDSVQTIYLPCYPELSDAQKARIIEQLLLFGDRPIEPLLFTMAVADSKIEGRADSRAELFERYIRRLMRLEKADSERVWLGWKRALELLAEWFLLQTGKRAVGLPHEVVVRRLMGRGLDGSLGLPVLSELASTFGTKARNEADLLDQLAEARILRAGRRWTFVHDLFEEYFAASRIVSGLEERQDMPSLAFLESARMADCANLAEFLKQMTTEENLIKLGAVAERLFPSVRGKGGRSERKGQAQ